MRRNIRAIKSYLDRVGENGILSAFVDKGFDTESDIDKGLAFEV
jgi:hypothetical protein